MVDLKSIRTSNQSLRDLPPGTVAVFVGATSGIGYGTLKRLARHVEEPNVFFMGRSQEKGDAIIDEVKQINPSGTYVFSHGDITLIKVVDRICEEIKEQVDHIDFLCLTPGFLSLDERKCQYLLKSAKSQLTRDSYQ